MRLVTWNPALETGDEEIDGQHRRIFALAETLASACTEYCSEGERVSEAVYELAEYVLEHFRAEEVFMEVRGYPELGPHRAQHQYLTGRTLQFTAAYMNGDEPRPETLAEFVTDWLTEHILAEDLKAVVYTSRVSA